MYTYFHRKNQKIEKILDFKRDKNGNFQLLNLKYLRIEYFNTESFKVIKDSLPLLRENDDFRYHNTVKFIEMIGMGLIKQIFHEIV
jgi:hypothetical protein